MSLRIVPLIILTFAALLTSELSAQQTPARRSISISGRIIAAEGGQPIEYANIACFRSSDSTIVTGTVSDPDGRFRINDVPEGRLYLRISAIGFENRMVGNLSIGDDDMDLGDISLKAVIYETEEVEVAADRAPVSYQIDKKVINVDRALTALAGTAVDVLKNVPSVTVDLDGSVRLRGSGSFSVLIDGRPSVLDGSDALEQISAGAIESIEIVTNPSARYNPEGVSGIINVIMKKGSRKGTTGMLNLNVGTQDRYGADVTLSQRGEWYAVHVGANYGKRGMEATDREESVFSSPEGDLSILAEGDSRRAREGYGVRAGADFTLSKKDNLGFSVRYGHREHGGGTKMDYTEQFAAEAPSFYISNNARSRGGEYLALNTDYVHRFEGEKHELRALFSMRKRTGDEETTDELRTTNGMMISGRRSTEDGPGRRMEGRLDYTRPLGGSYSMESGYHFLNGRSEDATTLSEYDSEAGKYLLRPEESRFIDYGRDIHAVYSMLRGEVGAFGFQAGLRGEYIERAVEFADTSTIFKIDRVDFFPTLHTSFKISATQQIMASYTRRIQRVRGWHLEPFLTWMDAYNVRRGNPDLQPEYIDSWELGYQTDIGDNMFSIEGYHRVVHDKIEHVRTVYRDNITLRTMENVGMSYSSGVELMLNVDPVEMWDVYLLGNLYNYRVEGELAGQSFAEERFTWNVRFNNTFKLWAGAQMQLNLRYNSESVSAQGRSEGYFVSDLALRQDFFNRRLSATLDYSDVLHTAERESIAFGRDFYTRYSSLRDAPVINLTLRYHFNDAPREDEREERNGGDFRDDDF